jgi:hypothetical protein
VTRDLGFSGLIRRTAPFSRLLRHTRGCGRSILTRILTGWEMKTVYIYYMQCRYSLAVLHFALLLSNTIRVKSVQTCYKCLFQSYILENEINATTSSNAVFPVFHFFAIVCVGLIVITQSIDFLWICECLGVCMHIQFDFKLAGTYM